MIKKSEVMEENENLIDIYIEIRDTYKELEAIKNYIKHNVTIKDGQVVVRNTFSFDTDLINLIKYIDTDFYNELQQEAEQ